MRGRGVMPLVNTPQYPPIGEEEGPTGQAYAQASEPIRNDFAHTPKRLKIGGNGSITPSV